jgi:hypothetical protein
MREECARSEIKDTPEKMPYHRAASELFGKRRASCETSSIAIHTGAHHRRESFPRPNDRHLHEFHDRWTGTGVESAPKTSLEHVFFGVWVSCWGDGRSLLKIERMLDPRWGI